MTRNLGAGAVAACLLAISIPAIAAGPLGLDIGKDTETSVKHKLGDKVELGTIRLPVRIRPAEVDIDGLANTSDPAALQGLHIKGLNGLMLLFGRDDGPLLHVRLGLDPGRYGTIKAYLESKYDRVTAQKAAALMTGPTDTLLAFNPESSSSFGMRESDPRVFFHAGNVLISLSHEVAVNYYSTSWNQILAKLKPVSDEPHQRDGEAEQF